MTTKKKTARTTRTRAPKAAAPGATRYAVRWIEPGFTQTYASGLSRTLAGQLRASVVKGMTAKQAARVKVVSL